MPLLIVAFSVLLMSCAGLSPEGVPAGGAPPESPVSNTPDDDPGVIEPTPLLVTTREGLQDVRARPWDSVEVLDDLTLLIRFYSGIEECYRLADVQVSYGAEAVTVTLLEGRVPGDVACIEIAVEKAVQVELDEPLEGRAVKDGAASDEEV